ncbi:hypothetical protein HOH87_03535 [bacterium]|jgi:hypothetical protein|nr:hypothetical protein [bacterium]
MYKIIAARTRDQMLCPTMWGLFKDPVFVEIIQSPEFLRAVALRGINEAGDGALKAISMVLRDIVYKQYQVEPSTFTAAYDTFHFMSRYIARFLATERSDIDVLADQQTRLNTSNSEEEKEKQQLLNSLYYDVGKILTVSILPCLVGTSSYYTLMGGLVAMSMLSMFSDNTEGPLVQRATSRALQAKGESNNGDNYRDFYIVNRGKISFFQGLFYEVLYHGTSLGVNSMLKSPRENNDDETFDMWPMLNVIGVASIVILTSKIAFLPQTSGTLEKQKKS